MLEHFGDLDEDMQAYFVRICRPCNHCLVCTKGGKNGVFTVHVRHGGEERLLCPQFPRHEWEVYDGGLVDLLFRYHDLQGTYAGS